MGKANVLLLITGLLFLAVFVLSFINTYFYKEIFQIIILSLAFFLCISFSAYIYFKKKETEKTIYKRIEDDLKKKLDKFEFEAFKNKFSIDEKNKLAKIEEFIDQLKTSLSQINVPKENADIESKIESAKMLFQYNQELKDISELMKSSVAEFFEKLRVEKIESVLIDMPKSINEMNISQNSEAKSDTDSINNLIGAIEFLMSQRLKTREIGLGTEPLMPDFRLKSLTKTFARYIDDEYKETRENEILIERKFEQVLKIAGLNQIRPKQDEQIDPKYHEIDGEQPANIPRNSIVYTSVRGFIDENGITKARVIIAR